MHRLAAVTVAALALSLPAAAQERTADEAFAEIEATIAALSEPQPDDDRARALGRLFRQSEAFLDAHLEAATPAQVERAGGYWLELAVPSGVEPERILAQIERLRRAVDPMPPRLERACRVVEQSIRIRPGQPAPAWRLPRVHEGEPLALEDLRGQLVLLDFWATWCGPCLRLMAERLRPLHRRYGGEGLTIVGVGTPTRGETAAKQAAFLASRDFAWPKVFDDGAHAGAMVDEAYGVEARPWLCLIDEDGRILVIGKGADVIDEIERILTERLGDSPGDDDH